MKTENVVGLLGLVALVGFIAFTLARYATFSNVPLNLNVQENVGSVNSNTNASSALRIADIALHATAGDCWIIVRAKVYNVTTFLARHPGGAFRITPYCGKDATTAFETKDGTGSHTPVAESELTALYIGEAETSSIVVPSNANANVQTSGNTNTSVTVTPTNTSTSTVVLSVQTVALHSRSTDCWVIVNNGVYAVTSYLNKHPGGAFRITPYCGKDATTAFATQGGTGSHSSAATADLAALRLGTLGSSTSTSTIQKVNTNASTLTPSAGGEREEEDDD